MALCSWCTPKKDKTLVSDQGIDESRAEEYWNLRHQALSIQRTEVGIPEPPPEAPAWSILMETGYPEGTATLLALSDGTTSIYLSSGGGSSAATPIKTCDRPMRSSSNP
jgi:hypothetical protein